MFVDKHELDAAWEAVHDALPVGWTVMRPNRREDGVERPWRVFASDLLVRSKRRDYIEATGNSAEALRDLAGLLSVWEVEP